MANKFRGTTWNNARFGPKIQIRRSIDLAELGDFGEITETPSDLPTAGAVHRKATGGSTSGTRGYTDLQGLFDTVVDNQDMGLVVDAATAHRIWSPSGAISDIVTSAPTGILPGSGGSTGSTIIDISGVSYTNKSFDVSSQATFPTFIDFNAAGTKMIIGDYSARTFFTYSLSTAWDASTASYDGSGYDLVLASGLGNPLVNCFGDDGRKLYTGDHNNATLHQHTLSIAYDVSTAVSDNKNLYVFNVNEMLRGPAFSSDGTKLYVAGPKNHPYEDKPRINQWDLTTAWDISTASFSNKSLNIQNEIYDSSGGANPLSGSHDLGSIHFNSSGTQVFLQDAAGNALYQYDLETAWDISTASYANKTFDLSNEMGYPRGLAFDTDGTKMYTVGNINDTVYQYDTNGSWAGSGDTDTVTAPAVSVDWSASTLAYTLDNPNAYGSSEYDAFGDAVAISGNYAIVGADAEDNAGGAYSGKAYIYDLSDGSLLYTLDNPNPYGSSESDRFGHSVAISDDHFIVGAYREDDGGTDSGKAYIYDLSDGSLLHTLDNPNPYGSSTDDYFGGRLGISGDRAIIGATLEDDANGSKSGKAYIYNVSTGALVHTLDNPHPTANNSIAGDQFGTVAISGDHAIVGAYNADDAGGTWSGKAYIYNVSTGALVHTLDNPNPYSASGGDRFGISVSISGDHAIVGSYEGDTNGSNSGKAYIYNVATGALVHTLDNPNPYGTSEYDRFGYSVGISGDHAIVSSFLEDDAGGDNTGKAYIYNVTSGALVKTLDNPNASTSDFFGRSAAISDGRVIIGAPGEDDAGGSQSGKAYIFAAG